MVSGEAWTDLVKRGQRRQYPRGAVLLRQGETANVVIALAEGIVKVVQTVPSGEGVPLALRGAGEVLGEMGALLDRPRSASVTAVTTCTGYVVLAHAFRGYLARYSLEGAVYRLAVERMQENEHLHAALTRLPIRARVARVVSHLAVEVGVPDDHGAVCVQLGMDREELAVMAAMSRSSVMAALRDLHATGVLTLGRGRLVVNDAAALARLFEE
ncbi:Crp/Fnr family transcriptional regulator [Streptomyces sp. NPDC021100]|uniref:Crp/Fnr family transcriptional regulator n=1 Tax=Streptomyces sp. NPDC021100 TaxID=3365114 RepID=UPI0037A6EC77